MIRTLKSEKAKEEESKKAPEKMEITMRQKKALRYLLLHDHLSFMKWSMRHRLGFKIMVDKFHHIMCNALERVIEGDIKRLIINIPPGYSKCVVKGTKIMKPDGSQTKVEEIYAGDSVASNDKGNLVSRNVIGTEVHKKKCVCIKTIHGRSIEVSFDHPVLTHRGWVEAGKLTTDDYLIHVRSESKDLIGAKPPFSCIEMEDFHYDRVSSVTETGEKEVYHLSVDADDYDGKNFIANGFVVHNTEMAVIGLIARGLAINPSSRFLHLSFSDDLVLVNSGAAKEVIESKEYQELFPMELKADSKGKKIWTNKQQGGLVCASAGGTITGFRAGQVGEGFTGALLIDDPIKPDDAYSKVKRDAINNRFTNTFKSRLMHPDVPIVMIMQRIHEDDPTGFLLRGGDGDKWHHLVLPAEILPEDEREEYPAEYTHGIEMKYDLPTGALWPYKYTTEKIAKMRAADPYTTASQYDQRPSPMGGGMFKEEWWQFYNFDNPRNSEYKFITADTAQKTKEIHDFSVFQCWGREGDKIYLLDQVRGKWEAPDLEVVAKSFIKKHYGSGFQTNGRLRSVAIEDKSSGTGLIQSLKRWGDVTVSIVEIQRNRDKVSRAYDFIPFISTGRVVIPENAPFTSEYLLEFSRFTPTMTHKHDDMIDPTLDAIQTDLAPAQKRSGSW